MDTFYLLGADGSGYQAIPDRSFDLIILHHVIEHMRDPYPILAQLCRKLNPRGYIWIAFPSVRTLAFPHAAQGTMHFCDDDSHVFVPEISGVSNVLLRNGVAIVHAGRTRDRVRTLVGLGVLPWAFLRRFLTGRLVAGACGMYWALKIMCLASMSLFQVQVRFNLIHGPLEDGEPAFWRY